MSSENKSIMSHVSLGTNDLDAALSFYDEVLGTLDIARVFELETGGAVAYGKSYPEFWVQTPENEEPAGVANGVHFAFLAPSKEAVHDFWEVALDAGGSAMGEPGPRPHYGEPYYGCFVLDLDGHKIEAMFWDGEQAI
ncbi:MAG: VOC family protein [Pseudomonadota bacterium]